MYDSDFWNAIENDSPPGKSSDSIDYPENENTDIEYDEDSEEDEYFVENEEIVTITIEDSSLNMFDISDVSKDTPIEIVISPNVSNIFHEGGLLSVYNIVCIKAYNIVCIEVSDQNNFYKSIDGNLYTKDGTALVQYAIGKEDTSFEIPNNVISIGDYAFYKCSTLTSITIPDSVTSIGEDAFSDCSSLTSVTLGNSVTSIGDGAFHCCYGLTSITVDEKNSYYKTIDGNLYTKDGTTLIQYATGKEDTSFEIPDSVTSIGDYAFRGCSNLTSITIPDSVTSIGDYAFRGCSNLTSITIPDSVTSIGSEAFYKCSTLTSITIPDSVTSIGEDAFSDCSSLTSVTLGNSVTSIGDGAFHGCYGLTSITVDENNSCYKSIDGNLYTKDKTTLIKYAIGKEDASFEIPSSVTSIGWGAFSGCSNLTSITIPDSVASIGDCAFSGCSTLTSIIIPDSVTSIGECTFYDCSSLTNVVIPDSVISIDNSFQFCSSLTSITIPDSVTSIGSEAFSYCSSLTSITYKGTKSQWKKIEGSQDIAKTIKCTNGTVVVPSAKKKKEISKKARIVRWGIAIGTSFVLLVAITTILFNTVFWHKTIDGITYAYKDGSYVVLDADKEIESADIKSRVGLKKITEIQDSAFSGCYRLTNVVIPDSVSVIGASAFRKCSNLKSIVIPNSVVSIGEYAFESCKCLSSIKLPDSVTSIGNLAFSHTAYSNSRNNWKEGVLYIGNHLIDVQNNTISREYVIKDGTVTIADYAFNSCSNITSVVIPDSVASIGKQAFSNCINLTSVVIPNSVTHISGNAFYRCTALKNVVIPKSVEYIGDNLFVLCKSLSQITFEGTKEEWNKIPGSSTIEQTVKCLDGTIYNN